MTRREEEETVGEERGKRRERVGASREKREDEEAE